MSDQALRARAIMLARAKALAVPPSAPATAGKQIEVVEFRLAKEAYGIAAEHVKAAIALHDFTPLPRGKSMVVGLAEWRGSLLSLIDPRQALGLSTAALNDLDQVVVVGDSTRSVGILVDAVVGTRTIEIDSLQPPSETSEKWLVVGIAPDALIVLDGAALSHVT